MGEISEVRYVNQPNQGYYGEPDDGGGLKLKRLISVYRQRLGGFVRPRILTAAEHQNLWFWKRVWAQFHKNWTYPNGTTQFQEHTVEPIGKTMKDMNIDQAFRFVSLQQYDSLYYMRRPGKIISRTWLAHILAEEGWKLDDNV